MPLNIKNDQVSALANQLAQQTGESITETVGKALALRQAQLHQLTRRTGMAAKLSEIGRRARLYAEQTPEGQAWLTRDHDAELYDERGLPR